MPLHGVSHALRLRRRRRRRSAARPSTSRWPATAGIYHKGWTAVTRHSIPWDFGAELPALDDDVWELYDTNTDWSQAHDIAAEHPDKLSELQRLWLIEAVKYNVLPLDDRRIERFNSDIAGRPVLVKGKTQLLYGGMSRLSENSVLNLKNKSHSVTAEVDVPEGGANGVDHRPGRRLRRLEPLPPRGQTQVLPQPGRADALLRRGHRAGARREPTRSAWSSPTTAAGWPRAERSTLYIDGKPVGDGHIDATVPMIYSGDETCDVGCDTGTPVSEDYTGEHQPLHRHGELGPARHRRRQPRPPHHPGGAHARGDRDPVAGRGATSRVGRVLCPGTGVGSPGAGREPPAPAGEGGRGRLVGHGPGRPLSDGR